MRLVRRYLESVTLGSQTLMARIRPLSGMLERERYGEAVRDMLQLLLPWGAQISPGDQVLIDSKPYLCVAVRGMVGHVQATVRRCHP